MTIPDFYFDADGRLCDDQVNEPLPRGYPVLDALRRLGTDDETDLQCAERATAVVRRTDGPHKLNVMRLIWFMDGRIKRFMDERLKRYQGFLARVGRMRMPTTTVPHPVPHPHLRNGNGLTLMEWCQIADVLVDDDGVGKLVDAWTNGVDPKGWTAS